jgi:hypothetical protein
MGADCKDESKSRQGQTSTSGAGKSQQSGSSHKATGAKSEGLMYRLRTIGQTVRKEVRLCDSYLLHLALTHTLLQLKMLLAASVYLSLFCSGCRLT